MPFTQAPLMKWRQLADAKNRWFKSDLFNIYKIIMLGFIIKRNLPHRKAYSFCNAAFIDKIMRFKLADLKPTEIVDQIDSFSSANSLVAAQSKLFIQLSSLLPEKDLLKAKETYVRRAVDLFSQRGALGQNGDLLRQFILKNHMGNLFSPELNRLFVEQTFLRLVKDGVTDELSQMSAEVYINILESCFLNDTLDPSEIFDCTKYALEKLKFAERPVRHLTTLVVAHSLVLKKFKGRAPEDTYSKLVDSLIMVISQGLQTIKKVSPEESFETLMFVTHTNSCLEIFKGHSKFPVFDNTWQILELEFNQVFKKNSSKIISFIEEGEEDELLPILEELNLMGSLYNNEYIKAQLLPPIQNRLETNFRKTSSSLVAQLINLAFKLESNFQVAPKYLSALKVSKEDPITSLQNASVTLDIFSKQQLTESLGPYLDELQDYLTVLLSNPETKKSQTQTRLVLTIFKQQVQLGRGGIQLFKAFFDFFKQKEVLEQVGLMPVLVQLLPALGIKTKKLAGAISNTSDDQSSNVLNVSQSINSQIKPSLVQVIL